jgi:hypothetical protein
VYTLTVNIVGDGSVTQDPDQAAYVYNDVVTLTATPDPGWSFSGWSGGLTGNPIQVTITDDTVVTATFTQDAYTLTVNVVGDGSVSRDPDQATYIYNDVVTLTATPDPGWSFSGWSDGLTGNPTQVMITDSTIVTATFTQETVYTLTVNIVGDGSVSVDPDQATYVYSDVVTLTATPDPGWSFSGWSGGLTGNPTQVTITDSTIVTATFTQDAYTLTVNIVGDGSVSVDPDQATYVYGDVVTLTATPDPGWSFSGWSGGLTGNPTQVTLTDNTTVTATFTSEEVCTEVSTVTLALLTTGDIYTDTLVQFQATVAPSTAVPYTYTLDYGTGASTPVQTTTTPLPFEHTFASTGTMTVTFAAWNCAMAESVTDHVNVEVSPPMIKEGPIIYLPLVVRNTP